MTNAAEKKQIKNEINKAKLFYHIQNNGAKSVTEIIEDKIINKSRPIIKRLLDDLVKENLLQSINTARNRIDYSVKPTKEDIKRMYEEREKRISATL